MLGLRQQIGRDERRVRRRVGDHEHLGGSRREVTCRAGGIAVDLRLGLGDPRVAGSKDLVDLRHGSRAVRHRRDGLRAAELEHALDAGDARRIEDSGIDAAVALRGATENTRLAPRQSSRDTEHQRGGGQGCGTRRHVEADALERPRHTLAAHAFDGVDDDGLRQLRLVECLDVRGRGANGRPLSLRKARLGGVELRSADLERIERHSVVLRRERAQRGVALAAHTRDDLGDTRCERRVVLERRARQQGGLLRSR